MPAQPLSRVRLFGGRVGGRTLYLAVAAALLVAYAAVAVSLAADRDWSDRGPLSLHAPPVQQAPDGALIPPALAAARCFPDGASGAGVHVVGGLVGGRPYYACYARSSSGSVLEAGVIDGNGFPVKDADVIKAGGAWPWVGVVKSGEELALGGAGLAVILWVAWAYRARPVPPPLAGPWYARTPWVQAIAAVPVVGWIVLWRMRSVDRARRVRWAQQGFLMLAAVLLLGLYGNASEVRDDWGTTVVAFLGGGYGFGLLGGRWLLAPDPRRARADDDAAAAGTRTAKTAATATTSTTSTTPSTSTPTTTVADGRPAPVPPGAAPAPGAAGPAAASAAPAPELRVLAPSQLPTFADVGGMDDLKRELRDTVGRLLAFAFEAETYQLTWNGVLLHGPPGVGKTFVAKALAGELGMHLVHVSAGDLVSAYRGESAQRVREAFRVAARHVPCVLFFDEFDTVARSRSDFPDQETRTTVNQLLQSLEEWRPVRELVVLAATNDLQNLDRAVTRPGRFDRHVRVDLPDAAARRAVLAAQLRNRPVAPDVDLGELAARTAGLTAASLAQAVELASLQAFHETTTRPAAGGDVVPVSMAHLLEALRLRGGRDRPTIEDWGWDTLVLAPAVLAELQQLAAVVEDPERARRLGVSPPSGLLLTGPPGTGKTTIARVLAAETRCSFYPLSGSDITSKWLGESEDNVRRIFERARDNRPSIVFIDEIDSIASRRGTGWTYEPVVNELLRQIDGIDGNAGVFVVGATNRADQLDPALLRGGRLSRVIEIPLPDEEGRRRLLALFTGPMPLDGVDVAALAQQCDGLSGADLKALCQQAAVEALSRADAAGADVVASVTAEDFGRALAAHRAKATVAPPARTKAREGYL